MIGIRRISALQAHLVIGHMAYDDPELTMSYELSQALQRVTGDCNGQMFRVYRGRNIFVVCDPTGLEVHVGEGPVPTTWRSQVSYEELRDWLAHFHLLANLDEWTRETIPRCRAHLVPTRVKSEWLAKEPPKWAGATFAKGANKGRSIWKTPPTSESTKAYTAAWDMLRYHALVPHGAPVQGYDAVLKLCRKDGIEMRRLRAVST